MIDEVFIVKIKCISFLLFGHIFFGHPKKICPNNKKEIYNDKYRHTRDRLFGLFKASVVVLFCSDIFWSFIRIFYCSVEKGKFVTVFIALYWVCLKVWLWVDREQAYI
jgi:hypothetical protein